MIGSFEEQGRKREKSMERFVDVIFSIFESIKMSVTTEKNQCNCISFFFYKFYNAFGCPEFFPLERKSSCGKYLNNICKP